MKTLYTAHATAVGGRNGTAQTDDGYLKVALATPGVVSSETKSTTNPEQLFACGYAACFGSALEHVAKLKKLNFNKPEVHADVSLHQDEHGFFISASLDVIITGLEDSIAGELVNAAHQVCPYSKATAGNIQVDLKVNGQVIPG